MSTIEIRNLTKIYDGGVVAVKNATVRIEHGEFVSIVGPSGCGKSSTLRSLAGLETITEGEILFDGKVVNNLSSKDRNVALAFESYALYSPLTIYENIAFPLRARKANKDEIKHKVMQIAEALEVTDVLDRKPGQLSGGQKQRVSLARALVRNPNVFLLDEPLSHMDSRSRVIIRERIRRIHDELQATTIYVTHDQEEAVALSDKIIVMNFGLIQQVGTVDDIWNHPSNVFVAGFVGEPSMNFIQGRIQSSGKLTAMANGKSVVWEFSKKIPESCVGSEVIVGIRPNRIRVFTESKDNSLEALVDLLEFQGDSKILTQNSGDTELRVEVPIEIAAHEGDRIWLQAQPDHIHLFDKVSGNALNLK